MFSLYDGHMYIHICLYEKLFGTLSNTSDFILCILSQVLKSGPGIVFSVSNSMFTAYFLVSPVATDHDLVGFYAESMMMSFGDFMQLLIMIFHASLPQSRRPYDGERLTEFFQKKNWKCHQKWCSGMGLMWGTDLA